MRRLAPCRVCRTDTLVPAGAPISPRAVCTTCGRCWEDWGAGDEVDAGDCPGCPQAEMCESRPTALVAEKTSVHVLADGTRVLIRPLIYSDRRRLAEGYALLSAESRRLRFFSAPDELSDEDLEYLANLDYRDHFAWAAFGIDSPGTPGLGVARYIRDPNRPTTAEAAVTVLDEYQHRGLGTLLLLMLVDEASRNGITSFVNYVMWENEELLDELRAAGGRVEPDEPGVARVEIDFPPPEEPSRLDIGRAILRRLAQATRLAPVGIRPAPDR